MSYNHPSFSYYHQSPGDQESYQQWAIQNQLNNGQGRSEHEIISPQMPPAGYHPVAGGQDGAFASSSSVGAPQSHQSVWNSRTYQPHRLEPPSDTAQYAQHAQHTQSQPQSFPSYPGYVARASGSPFAPGTGTGRGTQNQSRHTGTGTGQLSGTGVSPSSELQIYPFGTEPPRLRIIQACQKCRTRKAKCSGGNPCERCASKRISCEYAAEPRRGSTSPNPSPRPGSSPPNQSRDSGHNTHSWPTASQNYGEAQFTEFVGGTNYGNPSTTLQPPQFDPYQYGATPHWG